MKKQIILSLAIALALSSSAAVSAEPANTDKGADIVISGEVKAASGLTLSKIKPLPAEITGVIEEITEFEMKVKVKDGEVYRVPLGFFSKLEEFKDLGLAKGVNVTVKSLQPVMTGSVTLTQAPFESATIQTSGEAVKIEEIPLGEVKLHELKDANVPFTFESVPAAGTAKVIEFKEGEMLYIASEITANGKTVKADVKMIQPMMISETIALPSELSGTIESIDEKGMTVKAEDEKTYWIPLEQFKQVEGFKELGLEKGTKVDLKKAQMLPISAIKTGNAGGLKFGVAGEAKQIEPQKAPVVKNIELRAISDAQIVYFVDEITANGKTVKLSK